MNYRDTIRKEIFYQSKIGSVHSTQKLNAISAFNEALDRVDDSSYKDRMGHAMAGIVAGAEPEDIDELTQKVRIYNTRNVFEAAGAKILPGGMEYASARV